MNGWINGKIERETPSLGLSDPKCTWLLSFPVLLISYFVAQIFFQINITLYSAHSVHSIKGFLECDFHQAV